MIFIHKKIIFFRDSRPHSVNMMRENSTRYLEEMTNLLKEEFRYSTVYPVLGDMDHSPPGQAKPKESLFKQFSCQVHVGNSKC